MNKKHIYTDFSSSCWVVNDIVHVNTPSSLNVYSAFALRSPASPTGSFIYRSVSSNRWHNHFVSCPLGKHTHTRICTQETTHTPLPLHNDFLSVLVSPHVPPSGVRDLVLWSWSCVYRASQSLCLANEACDDGLLWKIFNFINLSWINDSFVLYQLNPKYIKLKQIGQSIHY